MVRVSIAPLYKTAIDSGIPHFWTNHFQAPSCKDHNNMSNSYTNPKKNNYIERNPYESDLQVQSFPFCKRLIRLKRKAL
jgi:hypothetical protein